MAGWPSLDNSRVMSYKTTALTGAAQIAGSYYELIASAPYSGVLMINANAYLNAAQYLYTIAIGAAGSETPILTNLYTQSGVSSYVSNLDSAMTIPLFINKGSRVSVKAQCTTAASLFDIEAYLISSGMFSRNQYALCDTIGAVTGGSGGTSIDPGALPNSKGSWVQLSASSARAYKGLTVGVGGAVNWTRTECYWSIDIGIGASPADQIIVPDYVIRSHTNGDMMLPTMSPVFPVYVPKATAISVRALCTIADATDRLFDVILYLLA